MFHWNKYPSIRLLIPFVTGILTYIYSPLKFFIPPFAIINLLVVLIILCIWYKNIFPNYNLRNIFGILLFIILIFLGFNMALLRSPIHKPNHCYNYSGDSTSYIAVITEAVKINEKYVKTIAKINEAKNNDSIVSCHGKVLLYIKRDSASEQLNYGDKIFFKTKLQPTHKPHNPEQFNYQVYLQNNGIFHQAFVKENNWVILKRQCGNYIKHITIICRDFFFKLFRDNNLKDEQFAVAAALILGYDDFIENELMQAYSTTGIIHIMCVSGMHVGLVFFIISFITFPLKKKKWGAVFQTIIVVLTIWFYSTITGLAPSIVRAATMFTIIAIAKTFKRNSDIYNTLALTALVLLWINPYFINNLGFILSYFAVISIVALEPLIYKIWEFRWIVTDKLWKLIAVSLAAQIGTFPLTIYLFHQFPNYFLISNLIAVPTSSIIIYSGIGLLILSPFHFISVWIGKALTLLIQFLNYCIIHIEKWPFANTNNISITFIEMLLIYILIFLIILLFVKPHLKKVRNILFIAAFLLFSISWRTTENNKQKMIVIYHHNKFTILDFIYGKSNYVICDSSLVHNKNNLAFTCKNYWIKKGVSRTQYFNLQTSNIDEPLIIKQHNYIQFFNTTLTFINHDWRKYSSDKSILTDIMVIDRQGRGNIQQIIKWIKPKIIVFTASCYNKRKQQWKEECDMLKIPIFDIGEKGAFIKNLE